MSSESIENILQKPSSAQLELPVKKDYKEPTDEDYLKLFEKEIRPDTFLIYYWLGESVIKEDRLLEMKKEHERQMIDLGLVSNRVAQNIGVPETEEIDYSIVKEIKSGKFGDFLRPYKNGLLMVVDENPRDYHRLELTRFENMATAQAVLFPLVNATHNSNRKIYVGRSLIKNLKQHRDDFTIYVVHRRAFKNKAYKLNFKNSNIINKMFSVLDIELKPGQKEAEDTFENFPDYYKSKYSDMLGLFDRYEFILDQHDNKNPDLEEIKQDHLKDVTKIDLLKASHNYTVSTKVFSLSARITTILKDGNKDQDSAIKKFLLDWFPEDYSNAGVTKTLFEKISNKTLDLNFLIKSKNKFHFKRNIQTNMFNGPMIMDELIELIFLVNYCDNGLSTLTGPIDTTDKTEIDCMYYWNYTDYFSMFKKLIETNEFPLFLERNEVFNKRELFKHIEEYKKVIQTKISQVNETYDLEGEVRDKVAELLKESTNQSTGLLIPHNACVELRDDPNFKYVRFVETEDYIHMFLHDADDRYLSELYKKGEDEFRYWLMNKRQMFDEPENLKKTFELIYLKLAACIRDWKILIERSRTMAVRSGPMIPTGVKSDKKRWIYFPRVRYVQREGEEQRKREKVFFSESRKFSGERRDHRRKLATGMKPSKTQLIMAEAAGMYLPEGYTYVKKTVWGKINKTKREIKYRNKSVNGLWYCTDDEFKTHVEIKQLDPAGFEEYCERYIEGLGYQVYKKWNYDGGIDIRGIKDIKGDKVQRLFVQCKHPIESGNSIGPDVVRELQGSVDLEMKDLEDCEVEKMVITSTRYTYKAVEAADKLNIKLLRTDDLE